MYVYMCKTEIKDETSFILKFKFNLPTHRIYLTSLQNF